MWVKSALMRTGNVALLAFYSTISSPFNDKDEHISGRWSVGMTLSI